jgi:exodeoxyribonuclease VII large subunit
MERAISKRQMDLGRLERRLGQRHPRAVLSQARAALGPLEVRLHAAGRRRVERLRTNLGRRAAQLDALSPLGILARGYSITTNAEGRAVRSAEEVAVGDLVTVRVHRGSLVAEVKETLAEDGSRGGEGGHG